MEHRSEQINELAIALAKAQAEMPTASLSNDNPFFKSKYAGLPEMVKASRPVLSKNGLSVLQQLLPDIDGNIILHTILLHSSGQWIESLMKVNPLKPDIQSLGSCISYLRRYSYAALVGVIATDEDDDGEATMQPFRNQNDFIEKKMIPLKEEKITKEQHEELLFELDNHQKLAEDILQKLSLSSFSDLRKSLFLPTIKRIRELKDLENKTKVN